MKVKLKDSLREDRIGCKGWSITKGQIKDLPDVIRFDETVFDVVEADKADADKADTDKVDADKVDADKSATSKKKNTPSKIRKPMSDFDSKVS